MQAVRDDAPPRLTFVDTLRFIAASAVVVQHLFEHRPLGAFNFIYQMGPGVFGVALFFLISGFVIPFSVQRGFDPRSFIIRRVFRVYPLVIAAFLTIYVLASLGITTQFAPILTAGAKAWIANLLLIQDYVGVAPFLGVTWTLIIELVWYGLFAATLMIFRDRAGAVLAVAAPIGLVLLAAASLASGIRIPLGRIGMIYAAIYGYQAYRHFTGAISDRRFTIDTGLFLGVMLIGNIVAFGWFSNPKITLAQAAGPWIAATLCFVLVYAPRSIRNGDFVNHRLFARFGAISYSVYLFHTIAITIARAHIAGPAHYVVAVILTFAIAAVTYALIEKPGIRLGKFVARAAAGRPRAGAAPACPQQ